MSVWLWGLSLNMSSPCEDVKYSLPFLSQLECLYIFLSFGCHMCAHTKLSWLNNLFTGQGKPLTSCETWICICWLGGHLPGQSTDTFGFSWNAMSILISSRVSPLYTWVITDQLPLEHLLMWNLIQMNHILHLNKKYCFHRYFKYVVIGYIKQKSFQSKWYRFIYIHSF